MTVITSPKVSAIPTVPSVPSYSAFATIAPQPAKTSANAARASAAARRRRSGCATLGLQIRQKPFHATGDLVSNPANRVEVLAGGVLELPVLVALAGIDGAGVPAAHRDHDVGDADRVVREGLWVLPAQIHPNLGHRLDHPGVELLRGVAAGRANVNPTGGEHVEEPRGHLAAPGVVDADE